MTLLIVNSVLNLAILWHCMCSLNMMPKETLTWTNFKWEMSALRLFYVGLGTSAMLVLAGPLYGYWEPQPAEIGITFFFFLICLIRTWISFKKKRNILI